MPLLLATLARLSKPEPDFYMASNRINILCILPSLNNGGAEIQLVNLLNSLDCQEFEKSLISFEENQAILNSVDTQTIDYHFFSRKKSGIFAVAREIARYIDQRQIDVIHCSLQIAMFVGWLARLMSKKKPKLVVAIHTTVNKDRKDRLFNHFFYQWLMRSCDAVIFVCNNQREYWKNQYRIWPKGQDVVIFNGIDTSWFDAVQCSQQRDALKENLGLTDNAVIICNIAGFRVEKGQEILLEALTDVVIDIPELMLLFVGGGVTLEKIKARAAELNMLDHVKFLGVLDDVRTVLAVSRLSVQASTAVETFSLAMLESLSMGVPMVATNLGGTSEAILTGKTGFLVPPADRDALADTLKYALSADVDLLDMGRSSKAFVASHFSRNLMVSRTQDLLIHLCR